MLRPTAKSVSRVQRWPVLSVSLLLGGMLLVVSGDQYLSATAQTSTASPAATKLQAQANPTLATPNSKFLGLDFSSVNRLFAPDNSVGISTGIVRLDGRKLFAIAAPTLNQDDEREDTTTPIQQRVESIENNLEQLASNKPRPKSLDVVVQTDSDSGLPVIYVNDRYVMTVTTLDATLQSTDLRRLAADYAATIRQALIAYEHERQPSYLMRQGLLATGILMLLVAGSTSTSYLLRRLRSRATRQRPLGDRTLLTATSDPAASGEDGSPATALAQDQMQQRQQYNFRDLQRWLLQVGQYGLWGGGMFLILGLFPYSRWLQPAILDALQVPLKILGIGLGIYLLIRISFILIDRFFVALSQREFIGPEPSRRLALRTSTFSRVFQSLVAVTLIGVGGLAVLAVLGVNLVPLLAGAGVIGLALSLASQSLIKDAINGFLILLEDQYGVGDVIVVGDVAGLVEYMNLRITQLRNNEGRLITIPNSAITVVQNLSKDWSRVDLEIRVAYQEHPDRALAVIRQVATEIYRDQEWHSRMPEPPEVLGIDGLDHGGILIRVWIKTLPLAQWSVGREFRRRLKLALDTEGIAIGVPQESVGLWDPLRLRVGQQSSDGGQSQQPAPPAMD